MPQGGLEIGNGAGFYALTGHDAARASSQDNNLDAWGLEEYTSQPNCF